MKTPQTNKPMYVISWVNKNGLSGHGTAAFELSEIQEMCKNLNLNHPTILHSPKVVTIKG